MSDIQNARLATLVALAEKHSRLGRTAFMKLCYFLQTLRNVPLGYRFRLYSYGPFDSSVLSDLASAEALGGLRSEIVFYPSGYGYEAEASENSRSVKALAPDFIRQYGSDIDWAIEQFANCRSADLELLSTIIYVDRESARANETLTSGDLTKRVHAVKPHFTESYIREKVADMYGRRFLKSLGAT